MAARKVDMTNQEKQKAIEAYDAWCEEHQVTLDGVKEIRASRDAWLGCWKYLKEVQNGKR